MENSHKTKRGCLFTAIFTISAAIVGLVIAGIYVMRNEDGMAPPIFGGPTNLTFVYFNDIHIDTKYNENSLYSEGTHCRTESASSTVPRPFGQYGCDIPEKTFDSMVDFLPSVAPNPDFILFGGDTVGHNLGLGTSGLKDVMQRVVDKLEAAYPNTPIFIDIGNNDYVVNYGNISTDADDFENVASVFGKFMDEAGLASFKKGGYYYKDFPSRNLRLFMLNGILYTNIRPYQDADPHDQMKWLDEKCKEAQDLGLKIGLTMHNPPGVTYPLSLKQTWHTEYIDAFYEIVKKYNVEFSICAHTHLDLLLPFHTENDMNASLFYIQSTPSLTTAHNNNPGFRVYTVESGVLANYDQYYADIMLNPQDKLDWQLEYSFNNVYKQANVSNDNIAIFEAR